MENAKPVIKASTMKHKMEDVGKLILSVKLLTASMEDARVVTLDIDLIQLEEVVQYSSRIPIVRFMIRIINASNVLINIS